MNENIKEFYNRINLKTDLSNLSHIVCEKYNLGEFLSNEIILVGYEDFNFILTTNKGKFCVKVFNKDRTENDIKMYIDRIKLANTLEINTPKVYYCDNNILCEIKIDNVDFKLCVFEYINGKTFYDLKELPTKDEIKSIIFQMTKIHNTKLESDFIYDEWTITNFKKEYQEKLEYLSDKYKELFKSLLNKLETINFEKLPNCFIHGDIIHSNVMKDEKGKIYIIDFASSNYLPRIVDLSVATCDFCFTKDSKEITINNINFFLNEYQKYNKLTEYELECFPLFCNLVNAMGILQTSYLKSIRQESKEDRDCINDCEIGLSYNILDLWKSMINK